MKVTVELDEDHPDHEPNACDHPPTGWTDADWTPNAANQAICLDDDRLPPTTATRETLSATLAEYCDEPTRAILLNP